MAQSLQQNRIGKVGLAGCTAIIAAIVNGNYAVAQNITIDGTLTPAQTLTGPNYNIPQAAGRTVGTNLFHSFGKFNLLDPNEVANFQSTGITNIFARVTGGPSEIQGLIRAQANLFLINPNGILFGPNAQLDVGGSFVASTANSLKFDDGTEFSATNPQPLLTISTPIGLQFGKNPGIIRNQSQATNSQGERVGLAVQPGRTLAIVGGEFNLEGGYLTAPEGQIHLGSVAEGLVSLNSVQKGWTFAYSDVQNFQDIKLSQQAIVNASGIDRGDIHVQGRDVRVSEGSQVEVVPLGAKPGGNLTITASGTVEVIGSSLDRTIQSNLKTRTIGDGDAGDLTITAKSVIVQNGGIISTGSFGFRGSPSRPADIGAGGNLTIVASDSVELKGETIRATPDDTWQSRLTSQTNTAGRAGDISITVTAGKLVLEDGAQIFAGTAPGSKGTGGNLTVNASSIDVIGVSADRRRQDRIQGTRISNATGGDGPAGTLTIMTGRLSVRGGGSISSSAVSREGPNKLSSGQAGNLNITASDSVEVIGGLANSDQELSRLAAFTEGYGKAGNLTISTGKLIIQDGAQVTAGARFYSQGPGGNLTVNASEVRVIGEDPYGGQVYSRLTTRTSGRGDAGTLAINTEKLIIQDGGQVSADSLSLGTGGKLIVNASDSVEVSGRAKDGFPTRLSAVGTDAPLSGDLIIDTPTLSVRDNAEVTVSNTGSGDAGNLIVQSRVLRLDQKGILRATTDSGRGGNIELRLQDLLLMRRNSQISTTAGLGGRDGNGGNITIDTPFMVSVPGENSDITANAFTGNGGQVRINAQRIFGFLPRSREELKRPNESTLLSPADLPTNDITAISQASPNLSGQVTINTSDVDPNRGLIALPTEPVTAQLTQGCRTGGSTAASEFIVTGRGGLPPNPVDALSSDAVQVGLVTLNSRRGKPVIAQPSTAPTNPLIEAQGWIKDRNGKVVLVAEAPTIALHSPGSSIASCPSNGGQ